MNEFYLYDINAVSYMLMNDIRPLRIERDNVKNKNKFYFTNSDTFKEVLSKFKYESNLKQFTACQNEVRKMIHSNK